MNSQILFLDSQQRSAEIERRAEARRRQRDAPVKVMSAGEIAIRVAGDGDRAAIERLSQLEGRRLDGRVLVAEVGGEVRAAIAIEYGAAIADPFLPTADLVELLRRARAHLNGGRPSRMARIRAALGGRLNPRSRVRGGAPTVLGNETSLLR
jgi:hypothetical protein